ncbi:aspartyl-phosphate phosphatase Spo0E family protein [Paenibacillus sp. PK3_47]|uniref:aspartyl-phosphate phosphatase Spo0E family protein n=1 Tax=Paenibacillus sp. PK3_47 TaxID=2072642 RepID=UPI00201DBABE|nr:aspartyl-phosphate phosphatase Spo0E family protein [Paenibacillus sp. PK3_47]
MSETDCLKKRMEQVRQELNNMQYRYELSHPAVVHKSMLLDELINEYNKYSGTGPERGTVQRSMPVIEELRLTYSFRVRFN